MAKRTMKVTDGKRLTQLMQSVWNVMLNSDMMSRCIPISNVDTSELVKEREQYGNNQTCLAAAFAQRELGLDPVITREDAWYKKLQPNMQFARLSSSNPFCFAVHTSNCWAVRVRTILEDERVMLGNGVIVDLVLFLDPACGSPIAKKTFKTRFPEDVYEHAVDVLQEAFEKKTLTNTEGFTGKKAADLMLARVGRGGLLDLALGLSDATSGDSWGRQFTRRSVIGDIQQWLQDLRVALYSIDEIFGTKTFRS